MQAQSWKFDKFVLFRIHSFYNTAALVSFLFISMIISRQLPSIIPCVIQTMTSDDVSVSLSSFPLLLIHLFVC